MLYQALHASLVTPLRSDDIEQILMIPAPSISTRTPPPESTTRRFVGSAAQMNAASATAGSASMDPTTRREALLKAYFNLIVHFSCQCHPAIIRGGWSYERSASSLGNNRARKGSRSFQFVVLITTRFVRIERAASYPGRCTTLKMDTDRD